MKDIFNDNVPLKTETPAFAKHVLPAVPSSEVYLEDCVKALKRYADKHFDLAIVDPPYGIGASSKNFAIRGKHKEYHRTEDWDKAIPPAEYWEQLFRVSKNQIVWGGNYFTDYLPPSMGWIYWDKINGEFSLADGELAWTSFNRALRSYKKNVASIKDRMHPTQKPIPLYEWILMNYAKEGDLILDTHAGSMSSVIACLKGGFNITAFEIDKEYFEKGKKRVETFLSQGNLFMEKQQINFIDTCSNE